MEGPWAPEYWIAQIQGGWAPPTHPTVLDPAELAVSPALAPSTASAMLTSPVTSVALGKLQMAAAG